MRHHGEKLISIGSTMLLVSGQRVGAAIHRQWIRDLRLIADEIEGELSNGKNDSSSSAATASGDASSDGRGA